MSTSNTSLRIAELDFDSIKRNLKNYLRSQSEFQDFDFEGSGMSVLIDLLAYNTHYMGYYLNMVGNESFMDTAQLRESMISIAKLINYTPKSSMGAETKINIKVTPAPGSEDTTAQTVTLDKYTRLLGSDINGINYPFVTLYSNTVSKVSGSFNFANVVIRQGEVITRQFEMDAQNTRRRFKIPSSNVDTTTLFVAVQESRTNTYTTVYSPYEDITLIRGNTAAYFIEEDSDSSYVVQFGDNVIGKTPKIGSIVNITYLDNVGSVANSINSFSFIDRVGGKYSSNVIVTSTTPSYGASEKESIEQVRFRAPYYYSTQNRAVTKNDYETLITKDFPFIESVSVWGGEDNDPVVYGKVYMSLKPKTNYVLTTTQKEAIKENLIKTRNVVTIIPEIIDPDYEYVTMIGRVTYNPSRTTRTADEILTLVKTAISDYNDNELKRFDSVFRKSKLQSYIESAEPSITGSDIEIYMQKRQILSLNKTANIRVKFDLPLRKGDYISKLYSFPGAFIQDVTGTTRKSYIEEVPESFTGVEEISVINPGINYISEPEIVITGDGVGAKAKATVVNGKILSIRVTSPGTNYTKATIQIQGGGGTEASAVAVLEARRGTLRTYYYKDNGEKVIINSNAGTIDYNTGEIYLGAFVASSLVENDYYPSDVLTFNVPSQDSIIPPLRNRILLIDEGDTFAIQLSVEAE
jgi:hypothetical protein